MCRTVKIFADRPLISCLPRSVNVVADFSDGYDAYRLAITKRLLVCGKPPQKKEILTRNMF